jgi:hypothetical protein
LEHDLDALPLGLVGEFEAHGAMRPLVDLLIVLGANISVLPQIAHVTDHERSHACLMQRGDEPRCLLI